MSPEALISARNESVQGIAMDKRDENAIDHASLVRCTANVVESYVGNHATDTSSVPALIEKVFVSFSGLNRPTTETNREAEKKAVVPVKRSVTPDYIICLEDGRKLKMLKRHLRTSYGMTPEEYRAKWNLPVDYPMVAPNYAAQRSRFAKKIGLGKNNRPA